MKLASVSKLNIYLGDPIFDRVMAEFEASQEEGLLDIDIDVKGLDPEVRMDFMMALDDLGYDSGYSEEEELLEVWYES